MSQFNHRQPIWTWSSVVLLSTLLLSPVAANTLLRALAQALPASVAAEQPGPPDPARPAPDPRRSTEEEEALRAAARNGQARVVRLDSDPDNPDAVVFLAPARAVVRVPDVARPAADFPGGIPPPRVARRADAPPRAPPAV